MPVAVLSVTPAGPSLTDWQFDGPVNGLAGTDPNVIVQAEGFPDAACTFDNQPMPDLVTLSHPGIVTPTTWAITGTPTILVPPPPGVITVPQSGGTS